MRRILFICISMLVTSIPCHAQSVIRLEIPGKGSYDVLEASSVPGRVGRLAEGFADLHPRPIDPPGGERHVGIFES